MTGSIVKDDIGFVKSLALNQRLSKIATEQLFNELIEVGLPSLSNNDGLMNQFRIQRHTRIVICGVRWFPVILLAGNPLRALPLVLDV